MNYYKKEYNSVGELMKYDNAMNFYKNLNYKEQRVIFEQKL